MSGPPHPPTQGHTHHCPKPLPAVFPLSLDLFSTRQTGGSGPHSHGPDDGAPWPDYGEFCQGPMHRREPPGSAITPAPTPKPTPSHTKHGKPQPWTWSPAYLHQFPQEYEKDLT